jgi:hypothetical protein
VLRCGTSELGVTGCRDDGPCATVGLLSAADAPLQRSELAKSVKNGHPDQLKICRNSPTKAGKDLPSIQALWTT